MAESRRRSQRRSTADAPATAAAGRPSGDLQEEYAYVFKDLVRLAIISGLILLMLIVVGYFL